MKIQSKRKRDYQKVGGWIFDSERSKWNKSAFDECNIIKNEELGNGLIG